MTILGKPQKKNAFSQRDSELAPVHVNRRPSKRIGACGHITSHWGNTGNALCRGGVAGLQLEVTSVAAGVACLERGDPVRLVRYQ